MFPFSISSSATLPLSAGETGSSIRAARVLGGIVGLDWIRLGGWVCVDGWMDKWMGTTAQD